jgi:hypothetical protein
MHLALLCGILAALAGNASVTWLAALAAGATVGLAVGLLETPRVVARARPSILAFVVGGAVLASVLTYGLELGVLRGALAGSVLVPGCLVLSVGRRRKRLA